MAGRYGQVIPETVATEAEELEDFWVGSAVDGDGEMALAGLEGMYAGEVLPPRVAQEAVVGLPVVAVAVGVGIAAAVDAVEIRCLNR